MTGCASPAAVSADAVHAAGRPTAGSTRAAAIGEIAAAALPRAACRRAPAAANDRAPSTSSPPPRCADEAARRLELGARELMALDVGEHERVVAKEILARSRDTRRPARRCATAPPGCRRCRRPARSCPCGRPNRPRGPDRPPTRASGSCARSRARLRRAARAAAATGGCTSMLRALFSGTSSPAVDRNLDGVDRRRAAARRRPERPRAPARRRPAGVTRPHFDRPAVLEQPQLDRLGAAPVAHGGHRQIDARVVEHRLGGGDAEHLAIAADRRCADAERVDRRRRHRPRARLRRSCRRRRRAGRSRQPAGRGSARARPQRARTIAAARRRAADRAGVDGREAVAEAEHLDVKRGPSSGSSSRGDQIAARDRCAPAAAGARPRCSCCASVSTRIGTTASRASSIVSCDDRPHQEEDEHEQRDEAQRDERIARRARRQRRRRRPATRRDRRRNDARGRAPTREAGSRRSRRPTSCLGQRLVVPRDQPAVGVRDPLAAAGAEAILARSSAPRARRPPPRSARAPGRRPCAATPTCESPA